MTSTALAIPGGSPSATRVPTVYQIDFTAVASGKRIASTKRRVRWRFGFANPEALANGETGTACRGEEHDITLVWSITSGKRLILADGQEVHYSSSRSNLFDFSWTMKGNHVLKVVAHASPPISAQPGFRQYDFFIDGQSFFTFPKVFKLGLAPNDPRAMGSPGGQYGAPEMAMRSQTYNNYSVGNDPSSPPAFAGGATQRRNKSGGIVSIEAPHTADEEEAYLREAIRNSLEQGEQAPSSGASVGGFSAAPTISAPAGKDYGDLLDFSDQTPVPAPAPYSAPPPTNGYGYSTQPAGAPLAALPPSDFATAPQPTLTEISTDFAAVPTPTAAAAAPQPFYGSTPTASGTYGASAPSFASPPAAAPFASPPPQYASPPAAPAPAIQQNGSFGAPPAPAAPDAFAAPPAPDAFAAPPAPDAFAAPPAAVTPAPAPVEEAPAAPGVDPAALTMKNLSGQDNPFDTQNTSNGSMADQAYAKFANMGDFNLTSKKETPRANPFDTGASSSITGNVSLADMKAKKAASPPKVDIMKSPQPGAGAMVVSQSQQQGNYGGYGQQYGAQPAYGQQPAPFGGAPSPMAQPPMQQQPQFGQQPPMQQQPQFGQQPPMQQYGQQPPPVQQGYGAPPPAYQGF